MRRKRITPSSSWQAKQGRDEAGEEWKPSAKPGTD